MLFTWTKSKCCRMVRVKEFVQSSDKRKMESKFLGSGLIQRPRKNRLLKKNLFRRQSKNGISDQVDSSKSKKMKRQLDKAEGRATKLV